MNQQDFTDAFTLLLSGAAEMENEKEIKWKDGSGWPVTIEFLNNSPIQAIVRYGGAKEWFLNGKLHREDGPAVEYADGAKSWFLNGQLHREDGPAIEYADGDKDWFLNGQLHREDGPAIECTDGTKSWYLNGQKLTREEFNKRTKPTICAGKVEEEE